MVNSVKSSDPSVGPATTTNTFGNLVFDPTPMGSTSAPSSLHGLGGNGGQRKSSFTPSSSSKLRSSSRDDNSFGSQQQREADRSGDDSASDSCSECSDGNCDCDASWIEISADDIPSVDGSQITEKIDNLLTSLSKIDASTSIGASLNPELADLEKQLIQLREDNIRLLSVLEATNEAMKKNLSYAQELKGELKSSLDEYDSLKSSADTTINRLREENENLRRRVAQLESDVDAKNDEPVAYHQFDVSKEMDIHEMSSQIASRDIRISQLMGEVNTLTAQLERVKLDLSRSPSQQSMSNSNHHSQEQQQRQQLMSFGSNQPTSPPMSSVIDQSNRSSGDGTNRNHFRGNQDPQLMAEINNLRLMVEKLREEKQVIESRLSGRRHRHGRHGHRHSMGTSYTANTAAEENKQQFGEQSDNNMETDATGSYPHGRHRRHHRHHSSKHLRRIEKKLAKNMLPVINSAVMFKGFHTFSTAPQ